MSGARRARRSNGTRRRLPIFLLAASFLTGRLILRFEANGAQVELTDQLSLLASFTATTAQSILLITGFEGPSHTGLHLTPSNVLYQLDTSGPVDATATITDIGSARIRGAFSGTLSDRQTDFVTRDGEFLVARAS
jgi:hypothetical protein